MKLLNNYVLLKVKHDTSKIQLKSGLAIHLDTSYEPEQHTSVVCEVVEVPDKLTHNITTDGAMPWVTNMDLVKGDEVIIYYMSYHSAFKNNRWVTIGEEEHFFVNYQNIYVAKRPFTHTESNVFIQANPDISKEAMYRMNLVRNGDIISSVKMLNGIILCEPHEVRIKSSLIIPEYLLKKKDTKILKVAYVGSPNREYVFDPMFHDDPSIESGDWIIVDKNCDIGLEHPLHRTFYEDNNFYRLQRYLCHGVVKNREAVM